MSNDAPTTRGVAARPLPLRLLTPLLGGLGHVYGAFWFVIDLTLRMGLTSLLQLRSPWKRTPPSSEALRTLFEVDPPYGRHRTVSLSGDRSYHCVETGSPDGTLVLMLHGFPQCWYIWRHQLAAMQDGKAGNYHAVALDLKGFGGSYKPTDLEEYTADRLTKDIEEIVHALGHERCILVGHDMGGVIAWSTAALRPAVVERLIIINAPHVPLVRRNVLRENAFVSWGESLRQLMSSWYGFVFRLPWPCYEIFFTGRDYEGVHGSVSDNGRLSEAETALYVAAYAQPGVVHCSVAYYHATIRTVPGADALIRAPTLVLWGNDDIALRNDVCLNGLEEYVEDLQICIMDGMSHFSFETEPKRVNEVFLEFLEHGNELAAQRQQQQQQVEEV